MCCSPMARSKTADGCRDYIYQNAVATKVASATARSRRYGSDEEEGKRWLQKQGFGQIPAYLQTWKAVLAQQHAVDQVWLHWAKSLNPIKVSNTHHPIVSVHPTCAYLLRPSLVYFSSDLSQFRQKIDCFPNIFHFCRARDWRA